jgi:hypothetical protein
MGEQIDPGVYAALNSGVGLPLPEEGEGMAAGNAGQVVPGQVGAVPAGSEMEIPGGMQ